MSGDSHLVKTTDIYDMISR